MRRRTQAPSGMMDYLFIKVFLHWKEKGFERFNMRLAPMAGFQEKGEASQETRWEPRYEICRNVLDLPRLAIALGKVAEIKE